MRDEEKIIRVKTREDFDGNSDGTGTRRTLSAECPRVVLYGEQGGKDEP